jgi:hypothetical protein
LLGFTARSAALILAVMCTPSIPDIAVDAAKQDAPIAGLPVARKTPPAKRFLAARPALILLSLYRVNACVARRDGGSV